MSSLVANSNAAIFQFRLNHYNMAVAFTTKAITPQVKKAQQAGVEVVFV
jgi:ABC-type sugar transport system substrate-binding protein